MGSESEIEPDRSTESVLARAAAWSVLTRCIQAGTTLVSAVLVGLRLDPATQGYYYTCGALLAFLPLAEFGVSYALMQSVSHSIGLQWTTAGLRGEPSALGHVTGLLRVARRWNTVATAVGACILLTLGALVLRQPGQMPASLPYQWIALVGFAAAWQLLAPRIALLEGSGLVHIVWRYRFAQEAIGGVVLGAGLLAGWGLFSLAASLAARVAHTLWWLRQPHLTVPTYSPATMQTSIARWRAEIWPFQWRVGVSILCGFLIYYLFTPVLLATHGPTIAGQFGMTLAVTLGLQNATTSWLNTRAPYFGTLIAAGRFRSLDEDFVVSLRRSTLLAVVGAVALLGAVIALHRLAPAVAGRLLTPLPFGLLLAAALVNHVVFALSVYLRAHRRDPFLIPSVVGAIATATAVVWTARHGSSTLVAGIYLALTVVGLVMAVTIFFDRRRRWHAEPAGSTGFS